MTAEEFVAKWGIKGGAHLMDDSIPGKRSFTVQYANACTGRGLVTKLHGHGEQRHNFPSPTPAVFIMTVAAQVSGVSQSLSIGVVPFYLYASWTAEDVMTLRQWMGDSDMWTDFATVDRLSLRSISFR